MTERLLQYIWQFQYFNNRELTTIEGLPLSIIHPGQYNTNQGPDFTDATIRINNTIWVGSVELHIQSSDWFRHYHQDDNNYGNVILHVVWEYDEMDSPIHVLELKTRVSKLLLGQYEEWMNSSAFIACENRIKLVPEITFSGWKERLAAERLTTKSAMAEKFLVENNNHWEEVFWWLLARNFGIRVNSESFEAIARSIPVVLLGKLKGSIHQLEALLFGQAGLLEENFTEDYPLLLQREYKFLCKKYGVRPVPLPVFFLRMRPRNFPSVRLAQLAMLVNVSSHLFSKIKEADFISEVRQWFDITANDYWHYHFRFEEQGSFLPKALGNAMINNILINTVIPLLFTYGKYHDRQELIEKAVNWLMNIPAENNRVIKNFHSIGIKSKNAFDSQALMELKNEYCEKKKCLDCAIGNYLLMNKSE